MVIKCPGGIDQWSQVVEKYMREIYGAW